MCPLEAKSSTSNTTQADKSCGLRMSRVKTMTDEKAELTQLLQAWQNGDEAALQSLTPLVQAELHRLARYYMAGERKEHTLQATALINEAWLRLLDWPNANWQDRAHLLAVSGAL